MELKTRSFSLPVICKEDDLVERSMNMKHKVTINVTDDKGDKIGLLCGARMCLPRKLVKWLFGEYTQVYLLDPGKTVESVNVKEVMEGGAL